MPMACDSDSGSGSDVVEKPVAGNVKVRGQQRSAPAPSQMSTCGPSQTPSPLAVIVIVIVTANARVNLVSNLFGKHFQISSINCCKMRPHFNLELASVQAYLTLLLLLVCGSYAGFLA